MRRDTYFWDLKTVLVNELTKRAPPNPMLVFFLFHIVFSGPTNPGDNSGTLKLVGTFHPESEPMTTTTTQAFHRASPKKPSNGLHVPNSLLHAQHRIWDSQILGLRVALFFFFSIFSSRSRDCSHPMIQSLVPSPMSSGLSFQVPPL